MTYISDLVEHMSSQIVAILSKNLFELIGNLSLEQLQSSEHSLRSNILNIIDSVDFRNVLKDWPTSFKVAE